MAKPKFKWYQLSLILLLCVGFNDTLDQKPLADIDVSKVMVRFNPYVSVLDMYNRSRYGSTDLIPLIEQVATRFNKIHVELSKNDFYDQRSLLEVPFAVALYNCLITTKNKTEVILEVRGTSYNRMLMDFPYLISLADKANTACNGTVVSILVPNELSFSRTYLYDFKNNLIQHASHSFHYSLGLSLYGSHYCSFVSNFKSLNVDVLLLNYYPKDFLIPLSNLTCEPYNDTRNSKKPIKLIKSLFVPYIDTELSINMTRSIITWRQLLTFFSDIYLISFAFDYYPELKNRYRPQGWWYLSKDPSNGNTSEYVFEEKISVASKWDFEENPSNFMWLNYDHKFDESTTGIVSRRTDDYFPDEFKHFCRLMNLNERLTESSFKLNSTTLKTPWFLDTCSNFTVYHLPIFKMGENLLVKTLDERLSYLYQSGPIKVFVYTLGDAVTTSHSYAYPLDMCAEYGNKIENHGHFFDKINEPNVKVIIFYFYEDGSSVRFGATFIVQQKKVLFEKCKNLVRSERKTKVEIAFASLGYFRVDTFSISPQAVQNYVKYIYLLENWAKNQTNIVIFLGQFEDQIFRLKHTYRDTKKNVVGWMSYYHSTRSFISKREEALELSMLHYPEPKYNITTVNITKTVFERVNITTGDVETVLTGIQVFLVVAISLVVGVITIVPVTILIYKCYKHTMNVELDLFLNGDDQTDNDAHKIPYDREKYEISEKDFKIEVEVPLGKGEFGAVYRGTIEQTFGKLQVAVKTSNPDKIHKTQLTGLLSEIKVLAYIGKHANITELFGANTESVKKGKVYIFLEFCHLGSLHKYLQEMRLLVSSPIQETNVDTVTHGNAYTNASASKLITLDDALSKDLCRWSTEICNGMAYLAEKHVVHADLAARNVLLNLRREAKICDFGLSRRMYNYTNYVKSQQEPLPWKWMAPESLQDMIFNEKTDVWAYGVTLWEIYSLARNPYAGLSWDVNFSQMLERGLRLSEPEYCERHMYQKMQKCWNIFPDNRPSFSEMLLILQSSDDDQASE